MIITLLPASLSPLCRVASGSRGSLLSSIRRPRTTLIFTVFYRAVTHAGAAACFLSPPLFLLNIPRQEEISAHTTKAVSCQATRGCCAHTYEGRFASTQVAIILGAVASSASHWYTVGKGGAEQQAAATFYTRSWKERYCREKYSLLSHIFINSRCHRLHLPTRRIVFPNSSFIIVPEG